MGSTGSGRFGNYHGGDGNTTTGSESGSGEGSGGAGSGTGEINCPTKIENIKLEDVATSEYYIVHISLPATGNEVVLNPQIFKGRLVVNDVLSGMRIGNLPTKYNYLINCLKSGISYTGIVELSGDRPVPFIVVTLNA